jgi:hypothetical protein
VLINEKGADGRGRKIKLMNNIKHVQEAMQMEELLSTLTED